MRFLLTAVIFSISGFTASAQEKWNLKSIVEHAMANNLGVKQTEVQAKIAALTLKQSKLGQFPNLDFQVSSSLSAGNSQNPVTFSRETQTFLNNGFQLQSSADIFNFYSKRNNILANEWELKAAIAGVGKVQNDIALSAANAYLQILLSMEQEKIAQVQIQQTTDQLSSTRKMVDAGTLPPLNALQLETQLAQDSVTYITTRGNTLQTVLALKSFMNIDAAAPFEVDVPPVATIPLEPIADLQPEYVYNQALTNQPQQLVNEYKLKAAEKATASARGAMYPSLTAFGTIGSNFIVSRTPNFTPVFNNTFDTTGFVANVNGINYNVLSPNFDQVRNGYLKSGPVGSQLSDNLRRSIGISIGVPIFRGGSLRANYERTKLTTESLELQKKVDNQKLKQDIYSAYNAALVAMQKFSVSEKSVRTAQETFDLATKRFNVGMLGTIDLIIAQNNLLRAKLDYSINQFDYVFKMKVLEFYKGLGLKL
jgi:outer membrane protein